MPRGSFVRQLNGEERQFVIDENANDKFWRTVKAKVRSKIGGVSLWVKTVSAVTIASLGWARGDDLMAIVSGLLHALGLK